MARLCGNAGNMRVLCCEIALAPTPLDLPLGHTLALVVQIPVIVCNACDLVLYRKAITIQRELSDRDGLGKFTQNKYLELNLSVEREQKTITGNMFVNDCAFHEGLLFPNISETFRMLREVSPIIRW